jgi:predicted ATPase
VPNFLNSVSVNPHVEMDREKFPFTLPVFKDFESLSFHPEVTFVVGENGSGKSTLLEAIAVYYGLSAEGGDRNHNFSTYDSHSELHEKIRLGRNEYPGEAMFLRAESFYNVASYLANAGGVRYGQLHRRFHGESFLDMIRALKPPGLYFFDEPEAALSIQGQLTLLALLNDLIKEGSQLIIATHSPVLLGLGRGWIYEFSEDGIERKRYRQTKSFQLTFDFLQNRERYARIIRLRDEDEERVQLQFPQMDDQ